MRVFGMVKIMCVYWCMHVNAYACLCVCICMEWCVHMRMGCVCAYVWGGVYAYGLCVCIHMEWCACIRGFCVFAYGVMCVYASSGWSKVS